MFYRNSEESKSRALDNLGRVYARKGEFRKAIDSWETKLPMTKTPLETTWLYHEIGRCHLELGQCLWFFFVHSFLPPLEMLSFWVQSSNKFWLNSKRFKMPFVEWSWDLVKLAVLLPIFNKAARGFGLLAWAANIWPDHKRNWLYFMEKIWITNWWLCYLYICRFILLNAQKLRNKESLIKLMYIFLSFMFQVISKKPKITGRSQWARPMRLKMRCGNWTQPCL